MPFEPLFRGVALLGMLWVGSAFWFLLSAPDRPLPGAAYALIELALILTVFIRLYCLRRWAALATCLFCIVATLPAVLKSEGWWGIASVLFTLGFGILTFKGWHSLSPGF